MRKFAHRALVGLVTLGAVLALSACGEGQGGSGDNAPARSVATGQQQLQWLALTEADAGQSFEVDLYEHDIGAPDKKGTEIHLESDDASSLRWRFAEKPDEFILEWARVDGKLPFETDGLLGDPTTGAKVIELRGNAAGETSVVFELVERDPAQRGGEPAKRLEFNFAVSSEGDTGKALYVPGGDQMP